MTKEEQENILKDFISKITDDVQDVPPEIIEAVNEHFFDLLQICDDFAVAWLNMNEDFEK